jgi:hypothetical protein
MKAIILILIFSFAHIQAQGFKTLGVIMGDDIDNNKYAIDLATNEFASKTTPANLDISGDAVTFLIWIKTPATLSGTKVAIGTDNNPSRGWMMFLNNATFNLRPDCSSGTTVTTSLFTAEVNTWYLFAFTRTSASTYTVWVDGESNINRTGMTEIANIPNNTLFIGQGGYAGFESYFAGLVGEVQIVKGYNLTADEQLAVFTSGMQPSYLGGTVVLWYKWSGGSDAVMLKDYSASGNNLSSSNVTTADQVKVGEVYK